VTLRAHVMRRFLRIVVRPLFLRGGVHDWRRRWPGWSAPRGVRVEPVRCDAVRAEWLIPPDARHGVLYYVHGGGFVMGSPATHRRLIARMAYAARARSLVVDYRLAPENPFPAALEDCVAGYRWLVAHGVSPREIIVAGDSAGACLALSMLVVLRDAGEALPAGVVCLSAATDLTLNGDSHRTRAGDEVLLTPAFCRSVDAAYRCGSTDARDPLASPLFADLRGLPPLLLHVGTHELFLDDTLRLAEKASAAGVDVTLRVWDGLWHVFQTFAWLPEAREAIEEIGQFARRRISGAPDEPQQQHE
jgi:monoterpene epsilon-lactone hydrolase